MLCIKSQIPSPSPQSHKNKYSQFWCIIPTIKRNKQNCLLPLSGQFIIMAYKHYLQEWQHQDKAKINKSDQQTLTNVIYIDALLFTLLANALSNVFYNPTPTQPACESYRQFEMWSLIIQSFICLGCHTDKAAQTSEYLPTYSYLLKTVYILIWVFVFIK